MSALAEAPVATTDAPDNTTNTDIISQSGTDIIQVGYSPNSPKSKNIQGLQNISYADLVPMLREIKFGPKDGSFFTRSAFIDPSTGRKTNESVEPTAQTLVIDADSTIDPRTGKITDGAPDPKLAAEVLKKAKWKFDIYPSYKYGTNGPGYYRYRIVFSTDRPYNKDELAPTLDSVFEEFHMAGIYIHNVPENLNWSLAWYLPRHGEDNTHGFTGIHGDGHPVNVCKPIKKPKKAETSSQSHGVLNIQVVKNALEYIDPDAGYAEWNSIGMALHHGSDGKDKGLEIFIDWSKDGDKYQNGECEKKWDSYDSEREDGITMGTLYKLAREGDWKGSTKPKRPLPDKNTFRASDALPVNCLPNVLVEMAKEGARFTHTTKEPFIIAGLVAVSSMLNHNVVIVEREGLTHNSSIGFVNVDISGGRKTEQFKIGAKGFLEFEKQCIFAFEHDKSMQFALNKQLTQEIRKLEKNISSLSDTVLLAKLIKQKSELKLTAPTLVTGDVTEEKLVRLMARNEGRITVFSDDARSIFSNIMGRYQKDGATGEALYIASLTGSEYRFHRQGNGTSDDNEIVLYNPCMNLLLYVQPDKIRQFLSRGTLRESGLMARLFMYSSNTNPAQLLRISADEPDLDRNKLMAFNAVFQKLEKLWDSKDRTKVILSPEARKSWAEASNQVADLMEGKWKDKYDLVNKIVSASVKIATTLTAIEHPDKFVAVDNGQINQGGDLTTVVVISDDTYKKAWELTLFFMEQNLNVYDTFDSQFLYDGARTVLNNIHLDAEKDETHTSNWATEGFKNNSIFRNQQSAPQRERMSDILEILVEYGQISYDTESKRYFPTD